MDEVQALLANIWFFLIGMILVLYVVLDGFDLGVGILSLRERGAGQHAALMSSIGSVWGANETWLVVLAGSLFGAFPLVFGIVFHALYVPMMLMLIGLIFRGISFEFIENAQRKSFWALCFGLGSLVSAVAQGFVLGGLLGGLKVRGSEYMGGIWDWLTPFTLLVTVGVVAGYTLLGAGWLILKTSGEMQERSYGYARLSSYLTLGAGALITLWTPLKFPAIAAKWFSLGNFFLIGWLPLLAIISYYMLLRAIARRFERAPFAWSLVIFMASFGGLAVSLFPVIIPPAVTLTEAASSAKTLAFMLPGIGMLIPIMVVYNGYQYLVFRGKVTEGA